MDLVVTVPKHIWRAWLEEGDLAGQPESDEEWGFFVARRPPIQAGERLYIVSWNRLRGYAPVTRLLSTPRGWAICRRGGAEAVTIGAEIPGFRGCRRRWWSRSHERPFPEWKSAGLPVSPQLGLFE